MRLICTPRLKTSRPASVWLLSGILFVTSSLWAYSSGPPNGVTGAPGESTCAVAGCHGNLNTGSGSVSLSAPSEYKPGDTIDISVSLEMLGQTRWGFEATVLSSAAEPVGTVLLDDPVRTQLSSALGGRQYVKHTLPGTDPGVADIAPGWNFRWVAPAAETGEVTIYVAGNAANGNFAPSGDYIYTSNLTVAEAVSTDFEEDPTLALPAIPHLLQNYPNPFNPSTVIYYSLPEDMIVTLDIYDVLGRHVRNIESGHRAAGDHAADWDGTNENGRLVASGVYFYRLATSNYSLSRKMVLTR